MADETQDDINIVCILTPSGKEDARGTKPTHRKIHPTLVREAQRSIQLGTCSPQPSTGHNYKTAAFRSPGGQ